MNQQTLPDKCLCGADPVVDKKGELFKYRCPNCAEKELPWLNQRHDYGALQEWNRIAPKKTYRKRTLEYNEHGVCIAEPSDVLEWKDKKGRDHITIKIYKDNGRFYYCYRWSLKNSGGGCGLWIGQNGYPTMELLKKYAKKRLGRVGKMEGIMKILNKLIPEKAQMELF